MLTNTTASLTDGTAIVAGRDKNQVAGLELKETMILCGRAAQTTHIKSIAVFFHPMEQIEVASSKFNMVTTEAEFTRFESELSFLQVRSTMTLQETIRQVKAETCEDRKQIAHTRQESIARTENPYSLMQVFGRGHQDTHNGATVYVTRCQAAEVLPRTHTNCTGNSQMYRVIRPTAAVALLVLFLVGDRNCQGPRLRMAAHGSLLVNTVPGSGDSCTVGDGQGPHHP